LLHLYIWVRDDAASSETKFELKLLNRKVKLSAANKKNPKWESRSSDIQVVADLYKAC
jgi:hypothetical protein